MAAIDSKIWDGFTQQTGGMNIGRDGAQLGAGQYRLLVNGTARGDYVMQRPGFKRIMEVRPAGGFFQHGSWLRTRGGQVYLMAVINGLFYRIDPIAKTVVDFTIPGDRNPYSLPMGWSISGGAEGFWIYQDGQTLPLITNGSFTRRATAREIKVGRAMAYANGRIWYSLPDGLSFRATDLVGNPESGTAAYNFKDAILKETENTYLNEGGDFSVPTTAGEIKAVTSTATLDTSQGQGPVNIYCERSIFSCNAPIDRTIWKDVQYPIQTVSAINFGASGAQNTIHANGDTFMRAPDGIRSFIVARRNFRDWGNTPQSFEVSEIIKYDQPDLLEYGSAAVFDNRMLMTCSPTWSAAGVYHKGLVALDLAPLSSLLAQSTPVYDGIWTGLNILSIQQTDIGTFLFVLTYSGAVELWQMTTDDVFDDEIGRVTWTFIPRSFFVERDAAGRPIWTLKELETARMVYDRLHGSVDFTLSWRPDQYPCWTHWHTWYECAPYCPVLECGDPPRYLREHYRPEIAMPTPPDACADGVPLPLRKFFELNTRLDVTGFARIRGIRFGAHVKGEPVYDPTCTTAPCVEIACCEFDPFTYNVHGLTSTEEGGSGSSGAGSGGSGYPVIPDPFIPPEPTPDVPIISEGGDDEPIMPPEPPTVEDRPVTPPPPPDPNIPVFVPPPTPTTRPKVPYEPGVGEEANYFFIYVSVPSQSPTDLPLAFDPGPDGPPDGLPAGAYDQWYSDLVSQFKAEVAKPNYGNLGITGTLIKWQVRWEDFTGNDDTFNAGMWYQGAWSPKSKWVYRLIVEYLFTTV